MESLVNFFFSDVLAECVLWDEVLYLPASALTSFLTDFLLLTGAVVMIGVFLGELTGSFFVEAVSFVWRKLKPRKPDAE